MPCIRQPAERERDFAAVGFLDFNIVVLFEFGEMGREIPFGKPALVEQVNKDGKEQDVNEREEDQGGQDRLGVNHR